MIQNNINIDKKIKFLLYKINNKTATLSEKNEYVNLLLEGGYIDKAEYEKYKKEFNGKESNTTLGETLVGIGIAVLLGTLISKIFEKE